MKEFGSDFHFIDFYEGLTEDTIAKFIPSALYYADGRQALIALYGHEGWKRLWVPEYFCREVVDTWLAAGLNIVFYPDYPAADDGAIIDEIAFADGDALFRVNFFGLRGFRSNSSIKIPVVEDHTHDVIGEWALRSDADWAVASLRKSLPVAEGGVLWSPVGHKLPDRPVYETDNQNTAERRWHAMRQKKRYLSGESADKESYRKEFISTESYFDSPHAVSIDTMSADYLQHLNLKDWYRRKLLNWQILANVQSQDYMVLCPESTDRCTPFSYTILCKSKDVRDSLRCRLIEHNIYPAILWAMPHTVSCAVADFSSRMLSIHCDGRYSEGDIMQMKSIIESILQP